MNELLTTAPPFVVLAGIALVAAAVPERVGYLVGAAGGILVTGWLVVIPTGAHVPVRLFGFDAVLLHVDPYSRLLGLAFGVITASAIAYAAATGAGRRQTSLALAYLAAGTGAAFAGDWLALVVFWELMAVGATLLVWQHGSEVAAGLRYAIYHEIGGLALIAGVLMHFDAAGTFLFVGGITPGLPALLVGLGIGLNAGILGLHVWIVDTYPRTHVAVSVVLAAVTTKVGAYAIVRAFPDGNLLLAYLGGGMVVFGVSMAILQTDMRRLLSYHIVSQVGYIVAGFGAGSVLASAGAMGHVFNHILYKALLFMVAGLLVQRTGYNRLKSLGGLARELPLTATMFAVAALSISGIPGFNGFVSKGMVLDGVEKAGLEPLWWVLLVGSIGTVVSFAKFGYLAFFTDRSDRAYHDLSGIEMAALGSLAGLCLLIGLVPGLLFGFLPPAAVLEAKPFAPKQFLKAGAVTVSGLIVFVIARTRLGQVPNIPDLEVVYHPLGRRVLGAAEAIAVSVDHGIDGAGRSLGNGARIVTSRVDQKRAASIVSVDAGLSIGRGVLAVVLVLVGLLGLLFQ